MKAQSKILLYAGLTAFCGAVFGAAIAFLGLGLTGHASNGIARQLFHMTFQQFVVFGGIVGAAIGWWQGIRQARTKFSSDQWKA
jgi:hypothetical protein